MLPRNCCWRRAEMCSCCCVLPFFSLCLAPATPHGEDQRHPSFFRGACSTSSASRRAARRNEELVFSLPARFSLKLSSSSKVGKTQGLFFELGPVLAAVCSCHGAVLSRSTEEAASLAPAFDLRQSHVTEGLPARGPACSSPPWQAERCSSVP